MKFRCARESLAGAVSMVSRAVAGRFTLPVLGNILLEAKGGEIHLAATNLAISIDCWIAGNVEQEGAITLPAKLLGDVLRRQSEPMVTVETTDRTVTAQICSGNAKAKLSGIAADQFPQTQTAGNGPEDVDGASRQHR